MAYLGRQPNTGVRSRYIYTATASQTTFSGSDDDGKTLKYEDAAYLDVFLNGVLLKPVTDYAATTKTSVVLTSGAAVSDIVEIVAYDIANIADTVSKTNGGTFDAGVTVNGTVTSDGLTVDTDTLYVDAANNRVGIGTAAPDDDLHIKGATPAIKLEDTDGSYGFISANADNLILSADEGNVGASSLISFKVDGTEAARIDENGTFCIGKTTTSFDDSGINIFGYGSAANQERINITRSGGVPLNVNRLSSDGSIIRVFKDGTTVGHIGANGGNPFFATDAGSTKVGILMVGGSVPRVLPCNNTGTTLDNAVDLGHSSARYDDLWATNNVIQTSDANEKQDVAELDEAERRVATAAKGLIRKYRWIDSVEEKGDDARIHVGIIAQDLKAAFEAEGLDPGRYAMFISSTWWEADETYTDDEGVEQTRTNTYDTAEEAPEGAVERTRLGVRYNQLLAFIIGAM